MFDDQKCRLIASLDEAHESYYRSEIFGGPSLYFHLKSLEAARAKSFQAFTEYVYATLAAWGMHRMGPGGAKMRAFDEFQSSVGDIWSLALRLQNKTPDKLNVSDWSDLRTVFCTIRCMASGASLVGNSKVMAHLLPNLIPPVDRQYTIKFLLRYAEIQNDLEREWERLRQMLTGFFYPIVDSSNFQMKAAEWLGQNERYKWDTSSLKIIDNLIIGLSRNTTT